MNKIVLSLFALVLFGAGCFAGATEGPVDAENQGNNTPPAIDANGDASDPVGTLIEDYINGDAVPVYENGVLQSLRSAQGNIYVITPLPNETVGNTFAITGNARVYENTVSYRIKNASGAVIDSGFATANSADIGLFGAYQMNVDLSSTPAQPITIEVYWESAKDGSDADLVSFIVTKQ